MKTNRFFPLLVLLVLCISCHGGTSVNDQNISKELDESSTKTLQNLIDALESESDSQLRNSIKRLRLMKSHAKPAVPKLLEIMSDPPRYSTRVQMEAMLAVAKISPDNTEVIGKLLLKLGHRDEEVRKKALEALYDTGTRDPVYLSIVEELSKKDQSRMVRKVAQRYYHSLKIQTLLDSRE